MYVHYEIYLLTAPGYWYVGSTTIGTQHRFARHLAGHSNAPILWKKIQELGSDAFSVITLEGERGDPIEAEQRWYDWYLANDPRQTLNGKRPDGWDNSMRGKLHTPETKAKMSASHRGHPVSPETRAKMQKANRGKTVTSETRAKISAAKKGQVPWNKGKTHSPETRAKISASTMGRIPWNKGQSDRSA